MIGLAGKITLLGLCVLRALNLYSEQGCTNQVTHSVATIIVFVMFLIDYYYFFFYFFLGGLSLYLFISILDGSKYGYILIISFLCCVQDVQVHGQALSGIYLIHCQKCCLGDTCLILLEGGRIQQSQAMPKHILLYFYLTRKKQFQRLAEI